MQLAKGPGNSARLNLQAADERISAFICGQYIIMSLDNLLESIPAYAKDIKLNLSSVLRQTELNPQQLWGTALACAIASRNPALLNAIAAESRQHMTEQAADAARTAASIMSMNNVFYRFLHLTDNEKYKRLPRVYVCRGFAHMASTRPISNFGVRPCLRSTTAKPAWHRTNRCCARKGSRKSR